MSSILRVLAALVALGLACATLAGGATAQSVLPAAAAPTDDPQPRLSEIQSAQCSLLRLDTQVNAAWHATFLDPVGRVQLIGLEGAQALSVCLRRMREWVLSLDVRHARGGHSTSTVRRPFMRSAGQLCGPEAVYAVRE